MVNDDDKSLWDLFGFSEKDERYQFMCDVIAITLAWQIRAMRMQRGWSQDDLSARLHTGQSIVSRLEDPQQVIHTSLRTLQKVAEVFEVALVARFSDWKKWMEAMLGEQAFVAPMSYREQVTQDEAIQLMSINL